MGVLRVILALCVYFFHTGWFGGIALLGPYRAVYSFFIISGFYMALILNKKYVGAKGSYFLFISNRFLRIYPIYWLILLLSVTFSVVLLFSGIDNQGVAQFLHYYAYLHAHNVTMLPFAIASDVIRISTLIITPSYFTTIPALGISTLAMAWTLVLEFLFYLIAPFLVRWKGMYRLVVIGGVFLIAYLFFHFHWLSFYLTSYAFISSLQYFMLGYLSFILYDSYPLHKVPKKILALCTVFFLVFVLTYSLLPLPHLQYKWMVFNDWIYYGSVTVAVPFLFEFSKLFAWDNIIADLSYPIYISHLLTNQILTYSHLAKPHTQFFIVLGLIVTMLFSFGIVRLIEKPIDKYRQKRIKATEQGSKTRTLTLRLARR